MLETLDNTSTIEKELPLKEEVKEQSTFTQIYNLDNFRDKACESKAEDIDILEQDIEELSPFLLKILLQDKTTGKYIRFACDEYAKYGEAYTAEKEILPELITKDNTRIIQPRISKTKDEQLNRTRKSAEVFTPSWICNEMNNHCDEEWFGRKNVFNIPNGHNWTSTAEPIQFKENKKHKTPSWQKYVKSRRLEITCGEAPYLVSRYDTTTGEFLPVEKRIGLLDRKLRIVNENTTNETDWLKWAKKAFETTYGYEYQGDNLLLARENLLWTFIDNFKFKHKKQPTLTQIKQIAKVIAWNIWQMDGLTYTVPFSDFNEDDQQLELFNNLPKTNPPLFCKVKNFGNKELEFRTLKGNKMKFDIIIGNPPYQMNDGGHGSSATAIYGDFFLNAKKLKPSYISMIMPSRWMTGGKGLDDFREEMISDRHIRILHDYMNSNDCFNSVQIEGGVCHFIWDKNNEGLCKFYTHSNGKEICVDRYLAEGDSDVVVRDANAIKILKKVQEKKENSFSDIVLPRNPFGVDETHLPFSTTSTNLKIFGRFDRVRSVKYLENNYLIAKNKHLLNSWKVFISKADGAAGQLGNPVPAKIIGKAELGDPNTICTETFLAITPFSSREQAINTIKYMETKFFRFMVGMRKLKNMTRDTYQFVPMQDFNESWTDEKLYKKYGLSQEEIDFIESMIKPME